MKEIIAIIISFFIAFIIPTKSNVKGIILPHHDLAKEIIHTSLNRLENLQTPSKIVILGTNHYYEVGPTFTTTKDVQDKYMLDNISVDDEKIINEHSIQILLPYLNEYFPGIEIISIIVGTEYEMDNLNEFSKGLIQRLPKDTIYIASVDFSHNQTTDVGISKNLESIDAISTFNYTKILDYKDDHLDSPVTITTLMLIMENLHAIEWETWTNSHGGLLTDIPNLNGTSYVVGIFK